MRKVYLTNLPAAAAYLRENGVDVAMLTDDVLPDMRDAHIIVIGEPLLVKTEAEALRTRGVPEHRLSYVETAGDLDRLGEDLRRPKHLRWDEAGPLIEAPPSDDIITCPSGLPFLDGQLGFNWRIPSLVVMAGAYGSGKSTVAQVLASHFVNGAGSEHSRGVLLCSWEDLASELRRNVSAFGAYTGNQNLLKQIHYVRINPSEERLVEWYIGLVEYYVNRFGIRFFVLDPWNEMDHVVGRENETQYTATILRAVRKVVDRLQIIMVILTHVPAKFIKGDGGIEPFKIGHSFGSSNFGNKADHGLCIVRTKKYKHLCPAGHTILRLDKSKIERLMGRKGTIAMRFIESEFRFEYDAFVTEEVKDVWKD